MSEKRCSKCLRLLPMENFTSYVRMGKPVTRSMCKDCCRAGRNRRRNIWRCSIEEVGYWGTKDVDTSSKSYRKWTMMLGRCYNPSIYGKRKAYRDCEVAPEWHNYANFRKWFDKNYYQIDGERMCLDKDLLCKGNLVYGPDKCCILPEKINTLIAVDHSNRNFYPIGIFYDEKAEKYRYGISINGKAIKSKLYDHIRPAFNDYKAIKEAHVKEVAEAYKSKLPANVYDALMRWTVEIDD